MFFNKLQVSIHLRTSIALILYLWRDKLSSKIEYPIIAFYIIIGVIILCHDRHLFDNSEVRQFRDTDLFPVKIKQSDFPYINLSAIFDVVEYLKDKPGNIVVIDDNGILIPLALRRAPSDLVLYYDDGLTVPFGHRLRTQWQEDYIEKLEKHNVKYIVNTLRASNWQFRWIFHGDNSQVTTIPILMDYIDNYYSRVYEKDGIEVLKKVLSTK